MLIKESRHIKTNSMFSGILSMMCIFEKFNDINDWKNSLNVDRMNFLE